MPWFDTTSTYPEQQLTVGGLAVHVFNWPLPAHTPTATLVYLIHGRGNSVADTRLLAFQILDTYTGTTPLVFVLMDIPNHGLRVVDAQANRGWNTNPTHALDMVLVIDAAAAEFDTLVDHVPVYLATTAATRFRTVVGGVSLGGHATYRLVRHANARRHRVDGAVTLIGSPDLLLLLLQRLQALFHETYALGTAPLWQQDYGLLGLPPAREPTYPRAFHELVAQQDREVHEEFWQAGNTGLKVLAVFGLEDTLVPPRFSAPWLQQAPDVEVYTEEGTGHQVTAGMAARVAAWLARL